MRQTTDSGACWDADCDCSNSLRARAARDARAAALIETARAAAIESKNDFSAWELVDHVGVDSGMMMLGDPCYVEKGYDYRAWIDTFTYERDEELPPPVPLTYVTSTMTGDGQYPVYVKRDKFGRVTALAVDFNIYD